MNKPGAWAGPHGATCQPQAQVPGSTQPPSDGRLERKTRTQAGSATWAKSAVIASIGRSTSHKLICLDTKRRRMGHHIDEHVSMPRADFDEREQAQRRVVRLGERRRSIATAPNLQDELDPGTERINPRRSANSYAGGYWMRARTDACVKRRRSLARADHRRPTERSRPT